MAEVLVSDGQVTVLPHGEVVSWLRRRTDLPLRDRQPPLVLLRPVQEGTRCWEDVRARHGRERGV